MTSDITRLRLAAQRLSRAPFRNPEDVVAWMGAVQAQEYADAKWALALRMRRADANRIEAAFTEGRILRTHVLRPTWHFVTPADIRWMLALTGPRVSAAMASYNRKLGLDGAVFRRSERAIVRALRGGMQLTRQELKAALERDGVNADGTQRLAHLVMQAELDAVICSGARRGKHFTYALLDERVPPSRALSRDDALAALARRYFTSHGPAQLQDFAWWSGLTMGDARAGVEMVQRTLASDTIDGRRYWFASTRRTPPARGTAYLLPIYDEYLIAFRDRSAALDKARGTSIAAFAAPIVVDGRVAGGWKRRLKKDTPDITLMPFAPLGRREASAVARAAGACARFFAP